MLELSPDSNLSHYRIVSKLGEGGMGEVYRAHDTRLNREVAIKVLPNTFQQDEDRVGRFKREAQVLASLNHPNIAAIYGLENSNGSLALIMELVEGPTLAERIAAGPMPFEDSLPIARQIAEALETAHERGIVHRDLKPANVKVTHDGMVKVLDFGLAKVFERDPQATDFSHSPTLIKGTQAGMILGTAAYMSPEQAKGKVVDKRSDIWAFGCVLFEMSCGKKTFDGETLTDTLAAVVRAEPDWDSLPRQTPDSIRRLLRRCLSKDQRRRLRDIGEARIAIDEALQRTAEDPAAVISPAQRRRRVRPWHLAIAAAILTAAALSILIMGMLARQGYLRPGVVAAPAGRYVVASVGVEHASLVYLTDRFSAAPDGSSIVFVKQDKGLFIRKRNQIVETELPGSPKDAYAPVFSPDGKWIAFSSENSVKKIPAEGGTPELLSRATDYVVNLTWGRDDVIRFPSKDWDSIRFVSSKGGQLNSLKFDKGIRVSRAEWLPGDRLLVSLTDSGGDYIAIRETNGSMRRLFDGADAKLTPANDLLYAKRDGSKWSLMTRSFDPSSPSITSDETVVAEKVAMRYATPAAATSTGDVFFVSGEVRSDRRIAILLRDGSERVLDAGGSWQTLRLSPDGSRLALTRWDGANRTIWTFALETGALTQVTYLDDVFGAVWLGGSNELLVTQFPRNPAMNGTTMWRVAADGSGDIKPLFFHPESYVSSTSQDGRIVYYTSYELNDAAGDLFALDLSQEPASRTPLFVTPADEGNPLPSPDAKWLAYTTNASGSEEVRLTSLGTPSSSTQITMRGGIPIRWSSNSSKLYYRDGDAIYVIDIAADGPQLGSRKTIFQLPADTQGFVDVFPDGEKAVVIRGGLMYSDLIVVQGFLGR